MKRRGGDSGEIKRGSVEESKRRVVGGAWERHVRLTDGDVQKNSGGVDSQGRV